MFANNKVPGFHVTSPQSNWKLETYVVLHRMEYGPQVWTNPGWEGSILMKEHLNDLVFRGIREELSQDS